MSDDELERRLSALLNAPVRVSPEARDGIMRRVRAAARTGMPRPRALSLTPRAARHSMIGLAMAASITSVVALSAIASHPIASTVERSASFTDSVTGTLRDTLRLMRLMRGDEYRYAFVVDGARWVPDPATIPVRPGDRLEPLLRVARDSN